MVLVTERFTTLAKAAMRGNGIPGAPMVVLSKTELTEYVEPEAVRMVAPKNIRANIEKLENVCFDILMKDGGATKY